MRSTWPCAKSWPLRRCHRGRLVLERLGALDAAHRQRRPAPPKGWDLPDRLFRARLLAAAGGLVARQRPRPKALKRGGEGADRGEAGELPRPLLLGDRVHGEVAGGDEIVGRALHPAQAHARELGDPLHRDPPERAVLLWDPDPQGEQIEVVDEAAEDPEAGLPALAALLAVLAVGEVEAWEGLGRRVVVRPDLLAELAEDAGARLGWGYPRRCRRFTDVSQDALEKSFSSEAVSIFRR